MHPVFVNAGKKMQATPIWFVHSGNLDSVQKEIGERGRAFVATAGFEAKPGRLLLLPAADGKLSGALFGIEKPGEGEIDRFRPGQLSSLLPPGTYRFANAPHDARLAALAFALGAYQFTRYRKADSTQGSPCQFLTASMATISAALSRASRFAGISPTRRPMTWAQPSWRRPAARSPGDMAPRYASRVAMRSRRTFRWCTQSEPARRESPG